MPLLAGGAGAVDLQDLGKQLETKFGPQFKVQAVEKSPFPGLYGVQMNGELYYTDDKAQFLIIGKMINTSTKVDYTEQRTNELNKVDYKTLPFNLSIKTVKGDGKRSIALFEDPNCPYCKQLRKNLSTIDNLTVHVFQLNMLGPDSKQKSHDIWCAPDKAKAIDDWMLNGKLPPAAPANCTDPHTEVMALGSKHKMKGIPTMVFPDGSRLTGGVDAKTIEDKLSKIK
ncbi:DsbC family protein [Undibacterium sp. SXout7W]|uniref:DsbC family protein n=1 Tax=Undibacterium sp. SXout7W TaxID=3413049 RepID=UPI003BF1C2A8